jgi:hypothetical protein
VLLLTVEVGRAVTVYWDGDAGDGLWSSAANWSGDVLPEAGDTIHIDGASVEWDSGVGTEVLPASCIINLTNHATLNTTQTLRMQGARVNVGSNAAITGTGWWDLRNGTLMFEDGAAAGMTNWEQKDLNSITFILSAAGFTTLTPGAFWMGNGTLSASISNATYTVDMAGYTGGAGTITLMDFGTDRAGMDHATFRNAGGLNVINAAPKYAGSEMVWNGTTEAIELQVKAAQQGLSIGFDGNARPVSITNTNGTQLLSGTSSDGFYLLESDNTKRRFDAVTDLGGGEYRFEVVGSSEHLAVRFEGTNDYLTARFIGMGGFALNGERLYFGLNTEGEGLRSLALDYMVDASDATSYVSVKRMSLWETNTFGAFALYEYVDDAQEDETLLDLWVNEGLPHPAVSGVWNRAAAEAWLDDWVDMAYDTSYLNIVPDTFEEHDAFMPSAMNMDAKAIYMWNLIWRGEYWLRYRQNDEVNPAMYPNGLTDLQSYSDSLAANGINLMLHYLCGNIGEEDPEFTSAGVHPDLQSWGTLALTGAVTGSATSFAVELDPGVEMPVKSSSSRPKEAPPYIPSFFEFKTFRIGNEWISASSVTDLGGGVWQLSGVTRGKWNTTAASYTAGQELRGYLRPYNQDFVPDPNSALFDTIATRWANLNNTLGTTKSEFDGLENHSATGLWGTEKFGYAVYENLDHPSTANTSSGRPPKAWLEYRFNRVKDALGGTFQTRQHASLFLGDKSRITPGLEELEHEMNKFLNLNNRGFSLGSYDVKGISLNTLQTYGQTDAVLDLVRDWKDASFALSPAERSAMDNFRWYDGARVSINGNHKWAETHWRLDGSDFRKWHALGAGRYTHEWHFGQEHGTITPRFYVRNGEFQTLDVPAELAAGLQKTRIVGRVLPRFDSTAAGNINLMPYTGTTALTVAATNSTGSEVWNDSDFTSYPIAPLLDLRNHRGVGCWVTGDGSGALLVIRLKRNGTARDYAVPIDFAGKRWIEMPTGEQAWRLKDWGWSQATRKYMDYQYVNSVEVGIGHIPATTTCSVLVEDLQALEETAEPLVNPSITLGEQTINLIGTIPVENHFILEPNGAFTVYDEHWNLVFSQALGTPLLPANLTTFSMHSASVSSNVWIEVGVQASNETLHNPAYTTNGTPWRWLDEYGLGTDLVDEDVDGHQTWQEYVAGTVPTDPSSVFKMRNSVTTNDEHLISWYAVSGKTYSVLFKTNLTDQVWIEERSGIPGVEPTCTHTSVLENAAGFYRIDVKSGH